MMDESQREILARGDRFARSGDVAAAIVEYLHFCARELASSNGHPSLRVAAVKRHVLRLDPTRRAVRRELADHFASLGLLDHALEELNTLIADADEAGDLLAANEARARLADLVSDSERR